LPFFSSLKGVVSKIQQSAEKAIRVQVFFVIVPLLAVFLSSMLLVDIPKIDRIGDN